MAWDFPSISDGCSRPPSLGGDPVEIYPAVQIEIESAVGIDARIDQRRETAIIFRCHTTVRCLQKMQRERRDLLFVNAIGCHFATLDEEDKHVGAVPVFNDLESFMDFSAEDFLPQIAA